MSSGLTCQCVHEVLIVLIFSLLKKFSLTQIYPHIKCNSIVLFLRNLHLLFRSMIKNKISQRVVDNVFITSKNYKFMEVSLECNWVFLVNVSYLPLYVSDPGAHCYSCVCSERQSSLSLHR